MENNNIANQLRIIQMLRVMKGRTRLTYSRTKYVKCFRLETSCYRLILRLKFILTVELLYDQAESDFANVRQKCGPLTPGMQ